MQLLLIADERKFSETFFSWKKKALLRAEGIQQNLPRASSHKKNLKAIKGAWLPDHIWRLHYYSY